MITCLPELPPELPPEVPPNPGGKVMNDKVAKIIELLNI